MRGHRLLALRRSSVIFIAVMPITLPLKKMSRAEKLRVMEALWTDLSQNADEFDSPLWHAEALREAEQLVAKGKAKFSDWEQAKGRIRRKASGRS